MYTLKLNGDFFGNYKNLDELSVELNNISKNSILLGNNILQVNLDELLGVNGYTLEAVQWV